MKHRFQSAQADASDATLVRPSNWNDTHLYALTAVSGATTLTIATDVVLATAGATSYSITLPTAVGIDGTPFIVKRIDAGVGVVTLATTSAQTIDGQSSYQLTNQWQIVEVMSNGANWVIINAN